MVGMPKARGQDDLPAPSPGSTQHGQRLQAEHDEYSSTTPPRHADSTRHAPQGAIESKGNARGSCYATSNTCKALSTTITVLK